MFNLYCYTINIHFRHHELTSQNRKHILWGSLQNNAILLSPSLFEKTYHHAIWKTYPPFQINYTLKIYMISRQEKLNLSGREWIWVTESYNNLDWRRPLQVTLSCHPNQIATSQAMSFSYVQLVLNQGFWQVHNLRGCKASWYQTLLKEDYYHHLIWLCL